MTPEQKLKFKTQAQTRSMILGAAPANAAEKKFDTEYYVEGYAARYEPYLLYADGDGKVYERFEPGCFDETDFSDVIMQHDHRGYVFARNTNNTLFVQPDNVGLFMAGDLGKTERARQYYEDIDTGMVTKMSWRFRLGDPRKGDYRIERTEGSKDVTIVHTRIPKVYDVSGVSIPANDNTEINARDFFHGVMEEIARSEAELEEKRMKLKIKIKCSE